MPIECLEWDSAFFGVQIGRLSICRSNLDELRPTLQRADDAGFKCLYWLIEGDDSDSSRAAELYDFHLVDVQLTFEIGLRQCVEMPPIGGTRVRRFEADDVPALLTLARRSHHHSRFYHDNHFSEAKCAGLYEEWIKRALGRESDTILVAAHENRPVGYCICHRHDDQSGSIDLVAVDQQWRVSGIGTALVSAAFEHFSRTGAVSVNVVTQGRNILSQRLYQSRGFVTKSMRLWYHRWRTPAL